MLKEVEDELYKGVNFLPLHNHHWVDCTLSNLAKHPLGYPQGWLLTVRALFKQARLEGE